MISIYLTNLGKYNEGELVGEWAELPMTSGKLKEVLERIGIDNVRYEEYFITDHESEVSGVCDAIGEYSNLSELNYLALRLKTLRPDDLQTLEAVIEHEGISDVGQVINLTHNIDAYYFRSDITNAKEYGEMIVDEGLLGDIPDQLHGYLDHEAIGNDYLIDGFSSITSVGLVEPIDTVCEIYSGYEDMPSSEEIDNEIEPLSESELEI